MREHGKFRPGVPSLTNTPEVHMDEALANAFNTVSTLTLLAGRMHLSASHWTRGCLVSLYCKFAALNYIGRRRLVWP